MTIFPFLKRICFFSILLFATQTYGQETIIPLTEGGWVGGLSGNVSWDDYKVNGSQVDGFNFSVSSRNGQFVINNLSVGFDFQWSEDELTAWLQNGDKDYEKNRLGFFGLWSRYYIPFIGTGWAIFPEISLGYASYKSKIENTLVSNSIIENSADGFAYNLGLGATMFVSNNVAFETTVRYQGGKLTGDNDLEIELSNIDILFGIMIYLK